MLYPQISRSGPTTDKMAPLPWLLAACSPALLVLLSIIVEGALSDEPYLETPKPRHNPFAEKQKRRRKQSDRFVFLGYYGATAMVDLEQLAQDQAAASWTEAGNPPETRRVTYSVIVVEWR